MTLRRLQTDRFEDSFDESVQNSLFVAAQDLTSSFSEAEDSVACGEDSDGRLAKLSLVLCVLQLCGRTKWRPLL